MDSDNTILRRSFLIYALILMTTGVALGAIGAHSLENIEQLSPENIDSWKTGVLYQLLMAGGIILMILLEKIFAIKNIKLPLILLSTGVSLFAFSIYFLVLNHIWDVDIIKYIMIPLTPIGGVLMIISWILLLFKVIKH